MIYQHQLTNKDKTKEEVEDIDHDDQYELKRLYYKLQRNKDLRYEFITNIILIFNSLLEYGFINKKGKCIGNIYTSMIVLLVIKHNLETINQTSSFNVFYKLFVDFYLLQTINSWETIYKAKRTFLHSLKAPTSQRMHINKRIWS